MTAPLPRVYRAEPWAGGPAAVYDRLAAELLARSPVPLGGALVLDAGAGTGAVSSAARAAGARVVATDVALDMLRHHRTARPPALAADVLALPLRDGCVDVAAPPSSSTTSTTPPARSSSSAGWCAPAARSSPPPSRRAPRTR